MDGLEVALALMVKSSFVDKQFMAASVRAANQSFVAVFEVSLQVFVEHHFAALFVGTPNLAHGTLRLMDWQLEVLHSLEAATLAAGAGCICAMLLV